MTADEREATVAKKRSEGIQMESENPSDLTKNIKLEAISNLVEHPTQIRPPSNCLFILHYF